MLIELRRDYEGIYYYDKVYQVKVPFRLSLLFKQYRIRAVIKVFSTKNVRKLFGADLSNGNLSNLKLEDMNFSHSNFSYCNLKKTFFKDTCLNTTIMLGVKLKWTRFFNCTFNWARFTDVDFNGTTISKCEFYNTTFTNCSFRNIIIQRGVKWDKATFENCEFDAKSLRYFKFRKLDLGEYTII